MARAGSVIEMYWMTSSIVQSAGGPLGNEVGVAGLLAIGVEDEDGGEAGRPVAVVAVVGRVADGEPVALLLPVAAGAGLDVFALVALCRLCDPVVQAGKRENVCV